MKAKSKTVPVPADFRTELPCPRCRVVLTVMTINATIEEALRQRAAPLVSLLYHARAGAGCDVLVSVCPFCGLVAVVNFEYDQAI